jgi:hypothetical protein
MAVCFLTREERNQTVKSVRCSSPRRRRQAQCQEARAECAGLLSTFVRKGDPLSANPTVLAAAQIPRRRIPRDYRSATP